MFRAIVACLALTACTTAAVPVPDTTSANAAIDALQSQGFRGSVLVACGDRIIYSRDIVSVDPAERPPSYWLASISKQFTAAAILRLAEARRLSIDDPL